MYRGCSVAVVVPAHNEERLIGRTIATLPDYVDHIVVVDDGSVDRTAERAAVGAMERPGFTLVVHESNQGVGGAIVSGYRRALQLRADVVVVVGADAQMDPAEMEDLLDALAQGRVDYVKGNRLAFPGVHRLMPATRLLGTALLTHLTRAATGYWRLRDSQCGYTAIRCEALRALELADLYPRYGYLNDLLSRLNALGLTVAEVPVRPIYAGETSELRPWRVAAPILGVLARAAAWRLWLKHLAPARRRRVLRAPASETA